MVNNSWKMKDKNQSDIVVFKSEYKRDDEAMPLKNEPQ
jgi:hypothetical protein